MPGFHDRSWFFLPIGYKMEKVRTFYLFPGNEHLQAPLTSQCGLDR